MASEEDCFFDPELFIDKNYTIQEMRFGDIVLKIEALHNAGSTDFDLTGQAVWPACKLLAIYLSQHKSLLAGKKVLELGAGVGLAGLAAAHLTSSPADVTITDHNDYVLEVLHSNIKLNFDSAALPVGACLSWGEKLDEFSCRHGDYDVILGADVVFWPDHIPSLVQTVKYFLKRKEGSFCLLSYVNRNAKSTEILQKELKDHGLKAEKLEIDHSQYDGSTSVQKCSGYDLTLLKIIN